MATTKKRLRKAFAPLSVSVALKTVNASSASLQQVYNTENSEFEPDRSISPLEILPIVYAGGA